MLKWEEAKLIFSLKDKNSYAWRSTNSKEVYGTYDNYVFSRWFLYSFSDLSLAKIAIICGLIGTLLFFIQLSM